MNNPYIVVLALFGIGGLITMAWGWKILARSSKTRVWPHVAGVIEESRPESDADDLLPHIVFSYTVDRQFYRRPLEFPGSVTPSREFTMTYIDKYPLGASVDVFYDPENPGNATLEPGVGSDWMIFALGLMATLFAVVALFM